MGVALGCIGLSYDDFCRLDFDEFASVYQAYNEQRDTDYKDRWQRMRLLATIVIQPHIARGKKITPEKLIPFPWDKKSPKDDNELRLTPKQQRRRMEQLVKQLGDTLI